MFYLKGKGKSKGNEREVVLKTATLLVAKDGSKRIKMKLSMPLSGKKMGGTPDWISNALTYVSQNHQTVTPDVELKGFDISFSDDHLFGDKLVVANKASLKSFVICEVGEGENPDVVMLFLIYAPFADKLWRWCGQLGGKDFFARFDQVETEADQETELTLVGDSPEPEEEEDEDTEEPDDIA